MNDTMVFTVLQSEFDEFTSIEDVYLALRMVTRDIYNDPYLTLPLKEVTLSYSDGELRATRKSH